MTIRPIILAAALGLTASLGGAQPKPAPFEGNWTNPRHSMMVSVTRCGDEDYCAVVVKASAKAQANARKGGTKHFIGTQILRVRPSGSQRFKGKAFDPESNLHVSATVTILGPGAMDIRGCAMFGMICEEQRWTKVS